MHLTYKYRLLPRRSHRRAFERAREASRVLYNAALEERISAWRHGQVRISKFDQFKSLTEIRALGDDAAGGLADYASTMGRWPLERLDEAFKGFFARLSKRRAAGGGRAGAGGADRGGVGFPRFRPASRWDSFGFTEFSGIRMTGSRLSIKGVARSVRLHLHRPLPAGASIRSCVITEQAGQWYACLQLELDDAAPLARDGGNTAGCDWGIENALTTDDGRVFETVQPGRSLAPAVRRAQRAVARARRGSKSRRKKIAALARLKRREANARSTRLHQIAAALVRQTPFVAMEELTIKTMTASAAGTAAEPGRMVKQKSGLNRAILDGAPARLREFIRYKAERAGGEMRAASPRRTSIDCAACGRPVPKALSQRLHRCDRCGFTVHRDENAACNIRRICFGDEAAIVVAYRQGQGGAAAGGPRVKARGRADTTTNTTNGGVVVPGRLNHPIREDAARNISLDHSN